MPRQSLLRVFAYGLPVRVFFLNLDRSQLCLSHGGSGGGDVRSAQRQHLGFQSDGCFLLLSVRLDEATLMNQQLPLPQRLRMRGASQGALPGLPGLPGAPGLLSSAGRL